MSDVTDDDDETDAIPEDMVSFTAEDCTCDHDPDDHGWTGCGVGICDCDAHWEE